MINLLLACTAPPQHPKNCWSPHLEKFLATTLFIVINGLPFLYPQASTMLKSKSLLEIPRLGNIQLSSTRARVFYVLAQIWWNSLPDYMWYSPPFFVHLPPLSSFSCRKTFAGAATETVRCFLWIVLCLNFILLLFYTTLSLNPRKGWFRSQKINKIW